MKTPYLDNQLKGYRQLAESGKMPEIGMEQLRELEAIKMGLMHNVNQRYTIEDIERCVENWGMCKVEKEYIEKFLNGG